MKCLSEQLSLIPEPEPAKIEKPEPVVLPPAPPRTKRCSAWECTITVNAGEFMCAAHWLMVPEDIKAEMNEVRRPGIGGGMCLDFMYWGSMAIRAVMRKAQQE